MNILLVEDDEMLLKSLTFFLRSNTHIVIPFNNGLDAISYIQTHVRELDLVITDLNLPFAGGQQVIHTTRQIADAHLPIMVLTSSGVESTEIEVFDLGADEFISKPFSPNVLLKRIEKLKR